MGWITRRIAGSITFTLVTVLLGSYAALQGWLVGGVSVFTTTGLVILGIAALCFLAKQGYALLTMARDEKPLLAAAKEFAAAGVPVVSLPGDVGDAHDRHRLLEAAAAHGRIDLLVNNASDLGDTPLPPLVQASPETFLRVFEINTL